VEAKTEKLVIVSGVSGSGKSSALKAFEDMGYFCVDNLPAELIPSFVEFLFGKSQMKVASQSSQESIIERSNKGYALLVDCREEKSFPVVARAIEKLASVKIEVKVLYLDCTDEVIIRRYKETRRPHPFLLSGHASSTIEESINSERKVLAPFREIATKVFDTTSFTPHELKRSIEEWLGFSRVMEVVVVSFGFKHGIPSNVDLVVDVRFLANPYFVAELSSLNGLDKPVSDFVLGTAEAREFVSQYTRLLAFLIPKYKKEGKQYLTIGVGCTGGKHRSVAVVEKFRQSLAAISNLGVHVVAKHRDLS
jgi:UPF0042 nucleotide-binding protein